MSVFTVETAVYGFPAVFYRGVHKSSDECARMLAAFREDAAGPEFFAPTSARLADELEAAMRQAGTITEHEHRRVA